MSLYVDYHLLQALTANQAVEAHNHDLNIQDDFQCRCQTFWVNKNTGSSFCVVEAPNIGTVKKFHLKAHGGIPNKIFEVNKELVKLLLQELSSAEMFGKKHRSLAPYHDSSFLVGFKTIDLGLLAFSMGLKRALGLFDNLFDTISETGKATEGIEIEMPKSIAILRFSSEGSAFRCISRVLALVGDTRSQNLGLRIGICAHSSNESDKQMNLSPPLKQEIDSLLQLLDIVVPNRVVLSAGISNPCLVNSKYKLKVQLQSISTGDNIFLETMGFVLRRNLSNYYFSVREFAEQMFLSKSGLYRIMCRLFGRSPNVLIKEFRLKEALVLLANRDHNISSVSDLCGFRSQSYFSKCFRKQYGLSPKMYRKLAQRMWKSQI